PPCRALDQAKGQPEKFWQQEDRHGKAEELERSFGVKPRPGREQSEAAREIFRPDVACLQDDDDTDNELRHPKRRRGIGHDPRHEMLARHRMQAFREQHPRMLEIALTPAPVARRKIDERGRTFLEASAKAWQRVARVTGPPDQGGLDKIMAEDMTAQG